MSTTVLLKMAKRASKNEWTPLATASDGRGLEIMWTGARAVMLRGQEGSGEYTRPWTVHPETFQSAVAPNQDERAPYGEDEPIIETSDDSDIVVSFEFSRGEWTQFKVPVGGRDAV